MEILSVKDVSKSFGSTRALDSVSADVVEGEITGLLGPSGCGKSTLLNIIAGLETPDKGDVLWNGNTIKHTPPHLRGFGLMFQDFALFPHMDVYANVAFGLKMSRMDHSEIKSRVYEVLTLVGLLDFLKRDVNTLSGGEQQRIALARALAPHPRLLMLDEPLGSLDRNLRERLVIELKTILKRMHQTAIYVTHDQEEAFTIADRIILMNAGKIEQAGTPLDIYSNPATQFVARFLEMTNFFPANIYLQDGKRLAFTPIGNFPIDTTFDGQVTLLLRPDKVRMDSTGLVTLNGELQTISFRGSVQRITMIINQHTLTFEVPTLVHTPEPGSKVTISFDPTSAIEVFPDQ